jgi:hypothetical protein
VEDEVVPITEIGIALIVFIAVWAGLVWIKSLRK